VPYFWKYLAEIPSDNPNDPDDILQKRYHRLLSKPSKPQFTFRPGANADASGGA
jgi:hypothetical protein